MTHQAIETSRRKMAAAHVPHAFFNAIRSIWMSVPNRAESKRTERAIRQMDSRMLKDIGIDRCEIMSVVYLGKRDRT